MGKNRIFPDYSTITIHDYIQLISPRNKIISGSLYLLGYGSACGDFNFRNNKCDSHQLFRRSSGYGHHKWIS